MVEVNRDRIEALGPAERIIQTLTQAVDHMVHNRPGMVSEDGRHRAGVKWEPITWKADEAGRKVVYRIEQYGRKKRKVEIGVLRDDGRIFDQANRHKLGEYRKSGLFPEIVTYLYRQIAEIWKLDNEFSARMASWAFAQDYRDLKVVLAAFMLVQSRSGQPVREDGEVIFFDDDYRDVGEAMCLIRQKGDINPKLLLRIGEVLELPGVAEINRELGFGRSARNPAMGRYTKTVTRWLQHRERNPKMLDGLVKAGFRTTVMKLARKVGYKPETEYFFEVLRWKQKQAEDGRREIAIGKAVKAAESWEGLSEQEICEKIVKEKPNYKKIVGLLPKEVGLTRAIMSATIESGCLSANDLIILTPTLEELGLLAIPEIAQEHQAALDAAENQRAANVARNVRSKEVKEKLEEAADKATAKALEEVTRELRIYVVVDISSSMEEAILRAKQYLKKMLQGFPAEQLHVSVFNTMGKEVELKSPTAAGVEHAFRGYHAGGGTSYAAGVRALGNHVPGPDEDALFIFIGDEQDRNVPALTQMFDRIGIHPVAFGMLHLVSPGWGDEGRVVQWAAAAMEIPCFAIEEAIFNDPYSVTRNLRNLIANTPVGQVGGLPRRTARKPLIETILETELLKKPVWACAA